MLPIAPPQTSPFDAVTGDLLPSYRDAYLRGQLTPQLTEQVEHYLKASPIQTNIVLGRHHELMTAAQAQGRTFVAPHWVQQQLLFQASNSKVAPLRRPIVRLAGGLFVLLCLASIVQWIRNEPLVPAPVVAAVTRVAVSASKATQEVVRKFTEAPAEVAAKPKPAAAKPTARAAAPTPAATTRAVPKSLTTRPAAVATLSNDSLTADLPAALPTVRPVAVPTQVRGQIVDERGNPLAGATVLVQGTHQATSTNATGHYVLEVPTGATLLFGYGGYLDQVLRYSGTGPLDVTLEPAAEARRNGRLARRP